MLIHIAFIFLTDLFGLLCYIRPSKKRMQKVANISIAAMFVMYLLTAIFGYLTFYGKMNFSKNEIHHPCEFHFNACLCLQKMCGLSF